MKVLQVLDTLNIGGAETLVKDYVLNFPPEVKSYVICLGQRSHSFYETLLEQKGIPVFYCSEELKDKHYIPPIPFLYRLFMFQKLLNQIQPDVIHAHLTAIRYVAYANIKNAKLFYTIHNELDVLATIIRSFDKCMRRCFRKKKMIPIALHLSMQSACNQRYGINVTQCLRNGIDVSRFAEAKANCIEFREQFGIAKDAIIIGNIGRLMAVKNHIFLVEILNELRKKGLNAELVIAGKGVEHDNILQRASALGIADFVHLIGVQEDTPRLYKCFDVFVMPSKWEGFPITLIEAQAAGLRCLISDVIDRETQILSTTRSCSIDETAGQWADALIGLLKEKKDLDKRKLEKFDIKYITACLYALYGGK